MVFTYCIVYEQVTSNAAEYQTRGNAFRLSRENVDLPKKGLLRLQKF
jgi:hypothetical protein